MKRTLCVEVDAEALRREHDGLAVAAQLDARALDALAVRQMAVGNANNALQSAPAGTGAAAAALDANSFMLGNDQAYSRLISTPELLNAMETACNDSRTGVRAIEKLADEELPHIKNRRTNPYGLTPRCVDVARYMSAAVDCFVANLLDDFADQATQRRWTAADYGQAEPPARTHLARARRERALPVNFLQNTFFRSNALQGTATARVLIPAECSAVS